MIKNPCPQCGQLVCWQDNQAAKPFCSERCKLIDLGEWMAEGYRIMGESTESDPDPSTTKSIPH